jgi:hypothetical protein
MLTGFFFLSPEIEAQIMTSRHDFEKEGFGVMMPLKGITVNGKHFFERYESLYDGSKTKLMNYMVDIGVKKSNETELEFIATLKKTINTEGGTKIREDLSEIKKTRNNYPYRSLKLTQGLVNLDHFFLFRKDQLVLLRFEYKSTNENYLSDAIISAVNQFLWLEPKLTLEVKEIGAQVNIPGELIARLNQAKTKLMLTYKDSVLAKKTNFRGSIENLGEIGKIDTSGIKINSLKEITSLPEAKLLYRIPGIEQGTDYTVDKYQVEFVEKKQKMELYMYLIYTGKRMFRYTISGAEDYYYKTSDAFNKVLKGIKPISP